MALVMSIMVLEKAQMVTLEGMAGGGYSSGRYDGVEAPPNGGRKEEDEDEEEDDDASGCPRYFLVALYSAIVGGLPRDGGGVPPPCGGTTFLFCAPGALPPPANRAEPAPLGGATPCGLWN